MNATSSSSELDPSYLDPKNTLLVIQEDHEVAVGEVFRALDGLSWLFNEVANAFLRAEQARGSKAKPCVEVPAEGMASLMGLIADKLRPAMDNPSIDRVLRERFDLVKKAAERMN